jgi:hypothetical protein
MAIVRRFALNLVRASKTTGNVKLRRKSATGTQNSSSAARTDGSQIRLEMGKAMALARMVGLGIGVACAIETG